MKRYDQILLISNTTLNSFTHLQAIVLLPLIKASLTLILVESCYDLFLFHLQGKNIGKKNAKAFSLRNLINHQKSNTTEPRCLLI